MHQRFRMPQKKKTRPAQTQKRQPGHQALMHPEPETIRPTYRGSGKLMGKVALVTGGDSGIGRAVAVHFAREGAKVAIGYLAEDADARETQRLIEQEGTEALIIKSDLASPANCHRTIERVVAKWDALDILVNNHAQQFPVKQPEDLKPSTVRKTFENNVFSFFHLIEAALPHLPKDAASSTRARSPACAGPTRCSTTRRPRAPFTRSRSRSPSRSPTAASA